MSIFQKARTLTLGSVHDLLDKAIDMNSPTVVRQQVRDIETSLNQLSTEAVSQEGTLRTLIREQVELSAKIDTQKATVSQLLKSADPNAGTAARAKAQVILTEQNQLKMLTDQITTQKTTTQQLNDTVEKLRSKHDELVMRVHQLESLDRDSKAKEHAAEAIKNVGSLLNSNSLTSVDDLQSKMLARNDKANAAFDQAMGTMNAETPENSADVEELLSSLK